MSTSEPDAAPDALTGAWIEVVRVSNFDGTEEEETLLGKTTGEVGFSKDGDSASWQEHMNRRTQRKPMHNTIDITIEALVVPALSALKEAGVIDDSGEEQYGDTWEALRLYVYDNESDETAAQTFEAEAVEFRWTEVTLPTDGPGTVPLTGWIHGPWRTYEGASNSA